jgi:hypothetical protein
MGGVFFEFLAQIGDVHIDDMVIVILIAPHLLQQQGSCKNATRVARQRHQQRKLSGGELNRAPGARNDMCVLVDQE